MRKFICNHCNKRVRKAFIFGSRKVTFKEASDKDLGVSENQDTTLEMESERSDNRTS